MLWAVKNLTGGHRRHTHKKEEKWTRHFPYVEYSGSTEKGGFGSLYFMQFTVLSIDPHYVEPSAELRKQINKTESRASSLSQKSGRIVEICLLIFTLIPSPSIWRPLNPILLLGHFIQKLGALIFSCMCFTVSSFPLLVPRDPRIRRSLSI